MTPLELLTIVGVLILARIFITVRAAASSEPGRLKTIAREYFDPFIYAGIAAWVLITFVARTYYIPSASMVPTLEVHDVLLVDKFEYRFHAPHRGDIVVFPPPIPTPDDFIKRVIGRPGDTLRIANGIVYVNGKALVEPYIAQKPAYDLEIKNYNVYVDGMPLDPSAANIPPKSMWTSPNTIPPNCYFMMGDNRNDSEDSHVWGFAQLHGDFATGPRAGERAGFTGRAFLIFWPFNQAKILKP